MKNITKVGLFIITITFGQAIARDFPVKMSVPNYATARSVKVATAYDDGTTGWGTGSFIGNGVILTENHVIADKESYEMAVSTGDDEDNLISLKKVVRKAIGHMVLKYDSSEFVMAVVKSSSSKEDLAILTIEDKVNPSIIFSDSFLRGDKVFVIGNPGWEDFSVVETTIKGVFLDVKNGKELHSMILLDTQKEHISPGFSGGAVLNRNGGVIGFIELGWGNGLCAAISSKDAQNYIKGVK
jgi:S1-C subfamily serine protease